MLENGKRLCAEMGIYKNKRIDDFFIKGDMRHTSLPDSRFDVVSVSQALQYNAQSSGKRDIEDILIEANRILKAEGYLIASLTGRTTTEKESKELSNQMSLYGFNGIQARFFESPGSKNGFYIITGHKSKSIHDYAASPFVMYNPKKPVPTGGEKKSDLAEKTYGGQ